MACGKASEITAFLKGEVTDQERGALGAHYASCAECSVELEKSRRLLNSLGTLERVEPSPDFTWKVRDALLRAHPEVLEAPAEEVPSLWGSIRAMFRGVPAWAISVSVHLLVVGIAALVFLSPREKNNEVATTGPKSGHVEAVRWANPELAGPAPDALNQSKALDRWKEWLDRMPKDAARAASIAKRAPGGEAAVAKAVAWLVEAQKADGGWGSVEATGLALLALLGDGRTDAAAKNAVGYLLGEQRASGLVGTDQGNYMMGHGIAAAALLEFALATGDVRAGAAGAAAVAYTVASQNESGGWGAWSRSSESDTVIGGWQILALRLAELRGDPGVLPALVRAHGRVRDAADTKGRIGTAVQTAVGMFSLQLSSPAADGGILARQEDLLLDLPVDGKDISFALFRSLALFQRGGDGWRKSWVPARDAVAKGQRPDGSWGGEVIWTATATLTLETPVRFPRLSE